MLGHGEIERWGIGSTDEMQATGTNGEILPYSSTTPYLVGNEVLSVNYSAGALFNYEINSVVNQSTTIYLHPECELP